MAVTSVKNRPPARKPYPKLVYNAGYVYLVTSRLKGVCISGSGAIGEYYTNGDFEASYYQDYEGSITLSNT